MADETRGASVLGKGILGGGREAQLRKGGGGYSAGMQSESWFDLPESFPIASLFLNPLLLSTLSIPPFPLHKTLWWVVHVWDVVVGGGGSEKIRRSAQVMWSPLGLTEFLTPFQFICLTAPSRNCLNC